MILATEEHLTEDDPDEDRDLYVRDGNGALRLLSDKGEEDRLVLGGHRPPTDGAIVYDDDRDDDSDRRLRHRRRGRRSS